MKTVFLITFLYVIYEISATSNRTCGVANTKATMVYEGRADIATYPWLGTFYYPVGKKKISTAVVLITKQIVLGAANEIDMLPKDDIRARSRVVLGRDCEQPGIRIREYSFHPEFRKNTYSAVALIQLQVDMMLQDLQPICGPPSYFISPKIYAMTPSNNCKTGRIYIRKMEYVNKMQCREFYRRSELDDAMFWPSHTTCARAVSGGKCIWRGGSALVTKQDGRWSLLGFGLSGPGCGDPARFLDYGMYQAWARESVARIGRPAITRITPNHLVMRRTLANLQRFGPCDKEETKFDLFSDEVRIDTNLVHPATATYNLTLIHGVEYSCIVLRGDPVSSSEDSPECPENPKIRLRRWCAGPPQMCHGFQMMEIHFFLEFQFFNEAIFSLAAYGKQAIVMAPKKALKYANSILPRPFIITYEDLQPRIQADRVIKTNLLWFYKKYTAITRHLRKEPEYVKYYREKYKRPLTLP